MRNDHSSRDARHPRASRAVHDELPLSRRRFLAAAGALGAAAWLAPRRLLATDLVNPEMSLLAPGIVERIRKAAATEPIEVQKLRGNLVALLGNGGNVVALPGDDGALLIDGGIVGPRVAEALATVTRAPIRHLVNTHWHFDHTDANAWHHAHGAAIVAHAKTRAHLATATRVADWDFTFPPSPAGALPQSVLTDEREMRINGARVRLAHYPAAHTDSDLSAHFADADVLHVGDTWWNGIYPFVDLSTGGSIDGMIRATERNLATASAETIVVPGHGAVGDRAALARWRDMMVAIRERVATLKQQGRPLAAVVAAKPTAAFDATYGGGIIGPDFFTRIVYESV